LPAACRHRRDALRLYSARLSETPGNTRLAMEVSYGLIDLAWIEHLLGQYQDSFAHAAQTLALQQRVADADAENFAARLEVAKSLVTTGLIYRDAGRLGQAIRCLREAASRFEAAMPHDTANQSTLLHLTLSLTEIGHTLIQRAQTAGRSKAQIRADWEAAAAVYDRAAIHLSRLSLGGKLMGILDPQALRNAVAKGTALCRLELDRAKTQDE
jgi:tetratricopeptide (TPR) repeat protein